MIKSTSAIMLLMVILTAFAVEANSLEPEQWISFTGMDYPTPAEIEVVEETFDSILVEMALDGVNVITGVIASRTAVVFFSEILDPVRSINNFHR